MSIDTSRYADPSYFKVSLQSPMAVAVAGGADAGKRDVCHILMDRLSASYAAKVAIISLTDFYRELDATERALYEQGKFNLDHPTVFDFDLLQQCLESIIAGKPTHIPVWDPNQHTKAGTRLIEPVDVILVEGTLVLYPKPLRDLMFMKVFIDVDSDERLSKRVVQHTTKGGGRMQSIKQVLAEYVEFVKPMFDDFIWPTKKFADIIIPRGVANTAALQVLGNHLEDHLKTRSSASSNEPKLSLRGKHLAENATEESASGRSTPSSISTRRDLLATTASSSYKTIPQ
ncbi:hypothetical protein VTP01DRAFT_8445 [Rhizomucor pusillus]|uniref:uncharacterized protein n=1 Tax=Rhizomucor pusillus TaxID=4840 RepID=UPI003742B5EA